MNFKKGSLFLILAWAIALVSGYIYNVWLTHRFSQDMYGDYQVIMSILVWLEIVVINGLPYTIQKFIGSEKDKAAQVLFTAARFQGFVAVFLFAAAFLAAPLIADLFGMVRYEAFLRLASIDILIMGFFHLLISYQNGLRHFGKQALLIVVYAVGKLCIGILLVMLWNSLQAALVANIMASVIGLTCGWLLLGKVHAGSGPPYPIWSILRFTVPSLGFLLLLNLLFYIDLWIVNYYLHSAVSGYYSLAGMLARAPYFLFIGVSVTMLPTLSEELSGGNLTRVRTTFRQAKQLLWFLLAPTGIWITLFSDELMAILFRPEYAPAAPILAVLVWGMIALAFLFLNTTFLNADHQPKLSFMIIIGTLCLDVILNGWFVSRQGDPQSRVLAAAVSTSTACLSGMTVSAIVVLRRFRTGLDLLSLFRIIATAAVVGAVTRFSGIRGIWVIPLIIAGFCIYTVILFIMGEIRRQDLYELFKNKALKKLLDGIHKAFPFN